MWFLATMKCPTAGSRRPAVQAEEFNGITWSPSASRHN
jgi:hypothetical protein